jgi:hypothetical protein
VAWRTLFGTFVCFNVIGAIFAYLFYLIGAPGPGHPTVLRLSVLFGFSVGFLLSVF